MLRKRILMLGFVAAMICAPTGVFGANWTENFDSYSAGQNLHGVNGWKGWDNISANSASVTSVVASSFPNSVAIAPANPSDLIHELSTSGTGQYTLLADTYVPAGSTGTQFFIMLNTYNDGGAKNWSLQMTFDNGIGSVVSSDGHGTSAPILYDQWVPIQVDIDLDANTQAFIYGSTILYSGVSWTEGASGGARDVAAVNLWDNGASVMYYDNINFFGNLPPIADADGPYTIWVDDPLILNASDSTDPGGDIVSYMWDLDNDGIFETDAGDQPFFVVDYATVSGMGLVVGGRYDINLKVIDGAGLADVDSSLLRVVPEPTSAVLLLLGLGPVIRRRKR